MPDTTASGRAPRARVRRRKPAAVTDPRCIRRETADGPGAGRRRPAGRHLRSRRAAGARRLRSTGSTSTNSTCTSACRRAASSRPRWRTACRRRRCTGSSSTTASTPRSSPRSSSGPRFGEFARCMAALPGPWPRARRCSTCATRSTAASMESFATLARAIPTGVFDNRAIDEFLARLFAAPGRTNDFRKLKRKLFLVATNLDTGASVTFGPRQHAHVPISRAIEASSALPGPVSAGRDRRRVLRRRRAQQDAACVGGARRGRAAAAVRQSARAVRRQPRDAGRPPERRQAAPGRPAAGARPDVSRDHPFADEGRHGEVPQPVSGRRRAAVRARSRGRRHVLREHLQLPAAQAPVRDGVREDAAEHRGARARRSRRSCASTASRSGTTGSPTRTATSGWR